MNHPVYFIKQLSETTSTDSRKLFLLDSQHICTLGWVKVDFPKCSKCFKYETVQSSER